VCWNTVSAVPVMRQSSYSNRPLTHEFTFAEFVHTFITCNFKVLVLKLDLKSGVSIMLCMHACCATVTVSGPAAVAERPRVQRPGRSGAVNHAQRGVRMHPHGLHHWSWSNSLDLTLSIVWTTRLPYSPFLRHLSTLRRTPRS
jgi:hypothetical protein